MDDRVPSIWRTLMYIWRTPRSAESTHGSPKGGRQRKPSKEDLLPKSGEVRLRIASSEFDSKEPSFNSRSSGNFLTPSSATRERSGSFPEEESSLLSRVPFVGKCLVEGSVVAFVLLNLTVMACLPCSWPGERAQRAAFIAVTMQVASLLQDLCSKQTLEGPTQQWLQRTVLAVKTLSMLTNAAICLFPTPFVTDVVTGRPNCMLRWAEWCARDRVRVRVRVS